MHRKKRRIQDFLPRLRHVLCRAAKTASLRTHKGERKSGNSHIRSSVAKHTIKQGRHLSLDNADILKEVNDARNLEP